MRRDRSSYIAKDPEARARQRANLPNLRGEPTSTTVQPGQTIALRHGGRSAALVADVSAEVVELMEALGAAAPLREPDGSLPAADVVAVERAARLLRRYRSVSAWVDLHGALDERTGAVKPAVALEDELGRSLERVLKELGMTPKARAELGLDLAKAADPLAAHLARRDQEADR